MRLRLAPAWTRCLCLLLALGFGHTLHAKRPNIIFILADDLGWADTALYNPLAPTPRIKEVVLECALTQVGDLKEAELKAAKHSARQG